MPYGVWTTSGWNWIPYRPRSGLSQAATGDPGLDASAAKPGRRLEHGVAVTHPALLLVGKPGQEAPTAVSERERGASELAGLGPLDATTEDPHHGLHPVADAEHRDPELEQLGTQLRSPVRVDGRRPPGQHQSGGLALPDPAQVGVVRKELGEHAALPDPPGDQLGVLTPEIEDQYTSGDS